MPGERRPHLLLLHGALGSSAQFDSLRPLLDARYQLHAPEFEGHGKTPPRDRPFRIEHFAENAADYLDARSLGGVDIFGYSMGGYVALCLAKRRPELVNRIATLGTKFHWDAAAAARETKMLDADKIEAKVPLFARELEARHTASGWRAVLSRTAEMMHALGQKSALSLDDLGGVSQRVKVGIGDRDSMVTFEETAAAYRRLPNGEMEVLPGTPHRLEKIPPERLARYLTEFFVFDFKKTVNMSR